LEEISGRAELLSGRQQNAEIEGHVNVVVCIVGAIIGVSWIFETQPEEE
jgi:hypothetical protein